MPLLGANGGLLGAARTSRRGAAVGLWTPNEQVIYQRQNAWIGDASFDSVSLLLHMDGSNGSTTFTDSSKNALTVTANGNAQISTAQSKFGGASAAFDGAGDYLRLTSSMARLDNGDHTVELWFNASSLPTGGNAVVLWAQYYLTGIPAGRCLLSINTGGTIKAQLGSSSTTSTSTISSGTWNHVAYTRSGSTNYLLLNGTSEGTFSSSQTILDTAVAIGALNTGSDASPDYSQDFFNGYIDDLRITKGVARYTANFTPPTAPFPNS
jgi:hypothetical protein